MIIMNQNNIYRNFKIKKKQILKINLKVIIIFYFS